MLKLPQFVKRTGKPSRPVAEQREAAGPFEQPRPERAKSRGRKLNCRGGYDRQRRGADLRADSQRQVGACAGACERIRRRDLNADSMQVYSELRILTSRPEPQEEAAAPHRLYGFRPAAQPYSAALWLADVKAALQEAGREGWLPIIVGGTGLYFKALTEGPLRYPGYPAGHPRAPPAGGANAAGGGALCGAGAPRPRNGRAAAPERSAAHRPRA